MKGGVFLGRARVLLQERETTAEGVRMKGVVWVTEGTSLFRCAVQHLRSLSESEKRMCSIADAEAISFQDLVRRLPRSTFLERDPSSGSSFWPQPPDATSRPGPDMVPPSRPVRADDGMSVQEHETTHAPFTHPSTSESIPLGSPVGSVSPEDSAQTMSTRRLLFKRPPNPLDRAEPPKRTRGDDDEGSALLCLSS